MQPCKFGWAYVQGKHGYVSIVFNYKTMMYGEDNDGSANFVFSLYVPIIQLFYRLNFSINFSNFKVLNKRMFFFLQIFTVIMPFNVNGRAPLRR